MSKTAILIDASTVTVTSAIHRINELNRTFQATVAGTGAVSATVVIDVSNDGNYWITAATLSLSGTTSATDGFASTATWPFTRSRITAISGTNAAVTVSVGV
jgi:P pilus assembly chaperone PapD